MAKAGVPARSSSQEVETEGRKRKEEVRNFYPVGSRCPAIVAIRIPFDRLIDHSTVIRRYF